MTIKTSSNDVSNKEILFKGQKDLIHGYDGLQKGQEVLIVE